MIAKYLENNKTILGAAPLADRFATSQVSDVVRADQSESIVFKVWTGVAADNTNTIVAQSCDNVTPDTATAIPFMYKKVISGDTETAVATAVAAGSSVAMTASTADQYIVVEIDPADVAAANSNANDKFCRILVTEAGNNGAQIGMISCILHGAKNAQAILPTGIV